MSKTLHENLVNNVAKLDGVEQRAIRKTMGELEHRRPSDIRNWHPGAAYEAGYWEALTTVALRLNVYRQVEKGRLL